MAMRRLCTALAVFVVLGFCLTDAKAQKSSKPVSKEDVLELLTGDVAPERVIAIVRAQGVSFKLTPAVEDEIRKAGGNDDLLKAIRELAPKPSAALPAKAKSATTEPPAGPPVLLIEATPGDARVYIDDEPVATTSPEGRLKLSTLSPGEHRVRLTQRGFKDYEETVQLTSGETTHVSTALVATATRPVRTPAESAAPATSLAATASGAPAYLGVRPAARQPAGRRGLVISDAAVGGPADLAGLMADDAIISIGGRAIRKPKDLEAAVASHQAGDRVQIIWSRGNRVITKSVQLSARPVGAPSRGSHPAGEKVQ